MTDYWNGLSTRERRLIAIMLLLVTIFILWIGVYRPVNAAMDAGWERYGAAVDRNASVRARMGQLRTMPARVAAAGNVEQIVPQSAAEAGLTLARSAGQGAGRLTVGIDAARAGMVLKWLAALEARGIAVETLSMTPAASPGTVTAQIVLKAGA